MLPLGGYTDGLEGLGHDLGPVVDRQHNVRHTGGCKSLNLVLDHWLVREFDERLWVGEGLQRA